MEVVQEYVCIGKHQFTPGRTLQTTQKFSCNGLVMAKYALNPLLRAPGMQ